MKKVSNILLSATQVSSPELYQILSLGIVQLKNMYVMLSIITQIIIRTYLR